MVAAGDLSRDLVAYDLYRKSRGEHPDGWAALAAQMQRDGDYAVRMHRLKRMQLTLHLETQKQSA